MSRSAIAALVRAPWRIRENAPWQIEDADGNLVAEVAVSDNWKRDAALRLLIEAAPQLHSLAPVNLKDKHGGDPLSS